MKNTIILGTGRSGTSLVAGLFSESVESYGGKTYLGNQSNPYGYFETADVNTINNELIAHALYPPRMYQLLRRYYPKYYSDPAMYWLLPGNAGWKMKTPDAIRKRIDKLCEVHPFCLKDPRFTLTLSHWKPSLPPDTAYIVVFRDPSRTVDSVTRFLSDHHADQVKPTEAQLYKQWFVSYRRLMKIASSNRENFFFLNTEDLSNFPLDEFEQFVDGSLARERIDPSVRRSAPTKTDSAMMNKCSSVFEQLCGEAHSDIKRFGSKVCAPS